MEPAANPQPNPGPSPRGRGNRGGRCRRGGSSGSIPAWAGKPQAPGMPAAAKEVHPRVGGETRLAMRTPTNSRGPSPRGRGNPFRCGGQRLMERSIPAWAGKPPSVRGTLMEARVHPRVGGETSLSRIRTYWTWGPSPRGRNRPYGRSMTTPAVHPRVGGETEIAYGRENPVSGPSPRGRGNLSVNAQDFAITRSIPAWAGKPAARSIR